MTTTLQALKPSLNEVEKRFRLTRPSENRVSDTQFPQVRKVQKIDKEWLGTLLQGQFKIHNWTDAILWSEQIENVEVLKSVPNKFFEKVYLTNPRIQDQMNEIKAFLYEQNNYIFNSSLMPYLARLIKQLIGIHRETELAMSQIPVNKESTRLELYQHLYEAKRYIDQHHCDKLNLKQIADIACLSECHFLRYFKATFDITPHQYITQKRLEKAQNLLRDSHLSIADISQKIGLDNLSSFSRLFKKHFGIPPEKYRKA